MEASTSLWAEAPARLSRWLEREADSWMSEVLSCSNMSALYGKLSQHGVYGKMSPVFCRRMEDGLLLPSRGNWKTAGIRWHGECWTRSSSELPKGAGVSFLSDTLEPNAPLRYYLSQRACLGILRRAEKRGRDLPPQLKLALERQAQTPLPAE